MIPAVLTSTIAVLFATWVAAAHVDSLTKGRSAPRPAANVTETTLTAANVNSRQFGKLYSFRADGRVTRPLVYVAGETIHGTRRNLLYVAATTGAIYVFDADRSATSPLRVTRVRPRNSVDPAPRSTIADIVTWESPGDGSLGYVWAENDVLKAYKLSAGRMLMPAHMNGEVLSPRESRVSLAISANASHSGTGIVWASMPASVVTTEKGRKGILRAFDAETLREIWNSEQNPERDSIGTPPEGVPPLVANGKVYVPESDGSIAVYGVLPEDTSDAGASVTSAKSPAAGSGASALTMATLAPDFTVTATPSSRTVAPGASATYTITITPLNGFTGTVRTTLTGAPAATTPIFSPASVSTGGNTTLTAWTSSFTPSGTTRLTITGTSGVVSHTAVVTLVVGPPRAIGIKFLGRNTATMAPGDIAGVVRKSRWNNAAGARSSAPLALVDDSGALRTATVSWSASGTWMTPIVDQPGNARLMKGYLDTSNTTVTTVTVAGLPTGDYNVYVYVDGDNTIYNRTATYTLSGAGITTTSIGVTDPPNTNFGGTFTQAVNSSGNYVKFRIKASGFTLTATPRTSTNGTVRAPINAIQIVNATGTPPVALDPPATVSGLGAGQGVELRDGKVYLYGDASTGIIREYSLVGTSSLTFTGRQVRLTAGGRDVVSHPTGLTVAPGIGTFLGNTVSQAGTIYMIDWARALATGTLEGAIQATVTDDLAVNGTRPEFVRVGQRWLIATADYGAVANEVRIYDPEKLKTATRTSDPGVLVYRFTSSPHVQTMQWLDAQGLLVLVQNPRHSQGWRLTVIDLARSIAAKQQVVMQTITLSLQTELEGFHVVAPGRGLFVTSSPTSNVNFANVRLF